MAQELNILFSKGSQLHALVKGEWISNGDLYDQVDMIVGTLDVADVVDKLDLKGVLARRSPDQVRATVTTALYDEVKARRAGASSSDSSVDSGH